MSNPALSGSKREPLVRALSQARSALRHSAKSTDSERAAAREQVNVVKVNLGERGQVWWRDGASDYNRHLAVNTPYREWYYALIMHEME